MERLFFRAICVAVLCLGVQGSANAQVQAGVQTQSGPAANRPAATAVSTVVGVPLPAKYVIGIGDVLAIAFWREQALSGDVVVRPDGKISLPLLNDVQASGSTPEELARTLARTAVKFVDEPDVAVIVKEIHSRRVFLVGQVAAPGMVPLTGDMNVLQLIAVGGGLLEYADRKNIVITRTQDRQEMRFRFNYDDVLKGRNVRQNIILRPGDTVVVP
jgi:polysaccharide export outer membrane protein